ncbi:hypothetical protein D1B31_13210 [Neobacillus notoginsengisoli]|uniref:Uncharacterized protein n=1 Tax=Neobacillus notoginsengisoli TaxID=1578198 RepID=A0A417YSH0_9BACI|nr:hypothetical protein D1B31_13210 [Neobacillus notoginsengisoli]
MIAGANQAIFAKKPPCTRIFLENTGSIPCRIGFCKRPLNHVSSSKARAAYRAGWDFCKSRFNRNSSLKAWAAYHAGWGFFAKAALIARFFLKKHGQHTVLDGGVFAKKPLVRGASL